MKVYTQLIDDLRSRLKDGTTPSALIRHILDVLGNAVSYSQLCEILENAFALPVARISPLSVAPEQDNRGIVLNKTILTEMVQRRSVWDAVISNDHPGEPSWMDGLSLKTAQDIASGLRKAPVPGLSDKSWAGLSAEEQDALYVQLTSSLVMSQRVEVMARLVERLQEKVHALGEEKSLAPLQN